MLGAKPLQVRVDHESTKKKRTRSCNPSDGWMNAGDSGRGQSAIRVMNEVVKCRGNDR